MATIVPFCLFKAIVIKTHRLLSYTESQATHPHQMKKKKKLKLFTDFVSVCDCFYVVLNDIFRSERKKTASSKT